MLLKLVFPYNVNVPDDLPLWYVCESKNDRSILNDAGHYLVSLFSNFQMWTEKEIDFRFIAQIVAT